MPPSDRFAVLQTRTLALAKHLLPPRKLIYSPEENDRTMAFVLLAHAEIEFYLEERVREIAKKPRLSSTISRLILYHTHEIKVPRSDAASSASNFFTKMVDQNHGIKHENVLRLLIPIGVDHAQLDETLLDELDLLGTIRGDFAHRGLRAQKQFDPHEQRQRVGGIVKRLKTLDRRLNKLACP